FGSSPSRCGPGRNIAAGQTWDLPTSDAFLLRVTCSLDPGRLAVPRISALLRSTISTVSAPATGLFHGSITHAIAVYASWPALPSAHATLATGRPATALPGPVFHRLDCTSFCWRLRKSRLVGSQVNFFDERRLA